MSLISTDEPMTCENNYILKKDTASLFLQTDYFQFEFPPPQYLGAKYLMREWIGEYIPNEARSILDVFAGSQSMAFYFKQRGLRVFSNDFMAFSHQIGLSLIENKSEYLNRNIVCNSVCARRENWFAQ